MHFPSLDLLHLPSLSSFISYPNDYDDDNNDNNNSVPEFPFSCCCIYMTGRWMYLVEFPRLIMPYA